MGYVFAVGIFALVGVALVLIRKIEGDTRKGESDIHVRWIGVAFLIFAFILYGVGGLKHVPQRQIGIPSSFSNIQSDAYGAGYHVTWQPWINLTDVPETVQTTTFEGCWGAYCTDPSQPRGNCLEVRIGGQQTACIDVTVQWRVYRQTAGKLYNDYAGQDGNLITAARDYLVERDLRTVENTVLDGYNPITDQQNIATGSNSLFLTFANQVKTEVQADLGSEVQVVALLQPLAYYGASTEGFLHTIQNTYAQDTIAKEQQVVNADRAAAFVKLGNPTLAQLIDLCLTSTVPHAAGWNCWPGSTSGLAISSKG